MKAGGLSVNDRMRRRRFLQVLGATIGLASGPWAWADSTGAAELPRRRRRRLAGHRVAILGGGVAGLSAAHELVERGFEVAVYEASSVLGGKARSIDVPGS